MNVQKISIAFLMMTTIGGCRLGNYSENPKYPASKYKNIELFYNSSKTFQTFAYYTDNTHTQNTAASLSNIPSEMLNTLTEPVVYLLTPTDTTAGPFFRGIDDNHTLQTEFDPTDKNKITINLATGIVPFFGFSACHTQIQIIEDGKLDRSNPGTMTYSDGTKVTVSGHLNLDLTFIQAFDGDCTAAFARLAQCFTTPTDCSKDENSVVSSTIDLYAKITGVLAVSDIPKLIGLAYKIHFE